MPVVGDIANPLEDQNATRAAKDESRLGYYKASLGNDVQVEMSATRRAGFYKYKFPQSGSPSNIVVDVSHVLPSYRGQGLGQSYLGGNISIVEDGDSIHYEGHGSYDNVSPDAAPRPRVYRADFISSGLEPRSELPVYLSYNGEAEKEAVARGNID